MANRIDTQNSFGDTCPHFYKHYKKKQEFMSHLTVNESLGGAVSQVGNVTLEVVMVVG
jgi:hypothetical protein